MIKLLLLMGLLVFSVFAVSSINTGKAYAVNVFPLCQNHTLPADQPPCNEDNPTTNPIILIIKTAIEVISYITGVAAVILIVVSAIKFITSGGDSNSVAGAKNTLIYAIVGLVITVSAQLIVLVILDRINP